MNQPSTVSPINHPPPAWTLRPPAVELRAVVLAARHGVPVHRVMLAIELSASPARRS